MTSSVPFPAPAPLTAPAPTHTRSRVAAWQPGVVTAQTLLCDAVSGGIPPSPYIAALYGGRAPGWRGLLSVLLATQVTYAFGQDHDVGAKVVSAGTREKGGLCVCL